MDLDLLRTFVVTMELASFTAAAKALGLSKQGVSRRIAALEAALGARLVDRSTRRFAPTEAGIAFHERVRHSLAELDEALTEVGSSHDQVRGTLGIAAPQLFSESFLAPLVMEYMAAHPGVSVQVWHVDADDSTVSSAADLVFGIGSPPVTSRRRMILAHGCNWCCASPDYLRARGVPAQPADLAGHSVVSYTRVTGPQSWKLIHDDGREETVRVIPRLSTNSAKLALMAVVQGFGIAHLPGFLARPEVAAGTLERVFPQWEIRMGASYVLYPDHTHLPAKIRTFLDLARERLGSAE